MWQQQVIDEIRAIDREQAPHGLYGLRDTLSPRTHLIPWSKLFGGNHPATNLAGRLGWSGGRSWSYDDSISFHLPSSESVHLAIVDFASTKVRHYGNSFTLDKVHGKKPGEDCKQFESIVPKLNRSDLRPGAWQSLLSIAHVPTPQRLKILYGKTTDEAFLTRYNLDLHTEVWLDIHDRRFHTGIALWSNHKDDMPYYPW